MMSFAAVFPNLVEDWHPVLNALSPQDISPHSHKSVWWKCKNNHEWQAVVNNRANGTGCPYCSGRLPLKTTCLAAVKPELIKEWHPRNELTPHDVTEFSTRSVWWICEYGHEWKSVVSNRSKGSGCPFCCGNKSTPETCLATVNPKLAEEWHPKKKQ